MLRKRWVRISLVVFTLLIIGAGAYSYSVYQSLSETMATMHEPISRETSKKRLEKVNLQRQIPFSVLILGVDERSGDRGRSDTMIVLTVNPNKSSVKMLSIPRDTRTEIIGRGIQDKINHAYAFGGIDMSITTVENLLDIPIDYYVRLDMEGFKNIVDAVGGITLENAFSFTQDGYRFPAGRISLNGEEALAYVRMRKSDPRGDIGRQQRQRQLIQSIIKKGANVSTLVTYNNLFNILEKNVKTNFQLKEIINIQRKYRNAGENIDQLQMYGNGTKINGVYYQVVPEQDKREIQQVLREHLEIT